MTINFQNLTNISMHLSGKNCELLIVTKNQSKEDVLTLINNGYTLFGENRIQEANLKFQTLFNKFNFKLHLIGKLQSNKVKIALQIFNSIQSIDSFKLVDEITKYLTSPVQQKCSEFYIQVNIGREEQKSGISIEQVEDLYHYARKKGLNIVGLMCIPPLEENSSIYFLKMNEIRDKINKQLKLSMGMSNDYDLALKNKSNLIRVGSLIFI